jgi:VanZ family protein
MLFLWVPVILQLAIIYGASSMSDPGPLPDGISDKGGHFIGYVILSVLLLRALAGGRISGITWRTALLAILGSTLYGLSDEFHQRFVPGRTPDLLDATADAMGGCVGAALGGVLRVLRGLRTTAGARTRRQSPE